MLLLNDGSECSEKGKIYFLEKSLVKGYEQSKDFPWGSWSPKVNR